MSSDERNMSESGENLSLGFLTRRLYNHRKWLEAYNFGFRKKMDCIILST